MEQDRLVSESDRTARQERDPEAQLSDKDKVKASSFDREESDRLPERDLREVCRLGEPMVGDGFRTDSLVTD